MSTQNVVERILSDAEREAQAILEESQVKAANILAEATSRAENNLKVAEEESAEKSRELKERRQAAARLECAKILLAEKRRVIDEIYASALNRLVCLDKAEAVELTRILLEKYAEEGDTVQFAKTFAYTDAVRLLPVVERKKLFISEERAPILGGLRLLGKISDRDLSYGSILQEDRERNQSALARKLFKEL
jgi:V/A-type H+-transporting ATPase subunit E